jgi:hypothetical protein
LGLWLWESLIWKFSVDEGYSLRLYVIVADWEHYPSEST